MPEREERLKPCPWHEREWTAVFFQESDGETLWWIGQLLEFDLVSQARTRDGAELELKRIIVGRYVTAEHHGIDPFDVPPPPERFLAMSPKVTLDLSAWNRRATDGE